MKTIIYLRTSTEEQTPQNQLRDCLTLIREGQEYEVVEEQQSAFKDTEREKFELIKNKIIKGEIKEFIVWDLDRIYRNRKKLLGFFELCKSYNCKILSSRQKWLSDLQNLKLPEGFEWIGEMQINNFIHFLGWIAEDESKKKSERVKIAYKNRKKKWGRKPLEDVESKIIELYKQNKSIREIATEVYYWDEQRNKKFVSKSAVHKIIENFKSNSSYNLLVQ